MTPDPSRHQAKVCRAIRVILRSVGLDRFWSDAGPTAEALHARRALGRPVSGPARHVLLAVFDVWDRKGAARLGDLLDGLPIDDLAPLFALALAVKADDDRSLDEWLARYGGR